MDASGPNDSERFETERPLDLCGHIFCISYGEARVKLQIVPAELETSQPEDSLTAGAGSPSGV
jgi:hypothetical protein